MSRLVIGLLFALLLGSFACNAPHSIDAPTQVLLIVACKDEALLRRTSSVRILVSSWERNAWRDVTPLAIDVDRIAWPLEVPIFPRKGSDESRQFQVIVQALEGDQPIAETRAVARFARGVHKRLERELYSCPDDPDRVCAESDCHGEDCAICNKRGTCEPVGMLEELPDDQPSERDAGGGDTSEDDDAAEPEPDASTVGSDGGVDMDGGSSGPGPSDSGAMDAQVSAPIDGASSDAGGPTDSAVLDTGAADASPGPCSPASLTRCGQSCVDLNTSAANCGRCSRACRSNQCSAGACAATSVFTHTPAMADAGTFLSSVAIDPPFLYFQDPASNVVQRVTTAGSVPSLVSYSAPDNINALRVDNGFLYSSSMPSNGGTALHRMALSSDQFVPIMGAQQSLYAIQMTTTTTQVLISSTLSRYYIQTIAKTGGTTFTTLAEGPSLSSDFEADDSNIFIRDAAAISRSSALSAGTPVVIAVFENAETCRDTTLTTDRLVFATSQRVASVPKAGGTVVTLASISATHVAADSDAVYYVHGLGNDSCSGGTEIYRVPLAGGPATRLASEASSCRNGSCCGGALLQDSSALYWVRGDSLAIRRVEK